MKRYVPAKRSPQSRLKQPRVRNLNLLKMREQEDAAPRPVHLMDWVVKVDEE